MNTAEFGAVCMDLRERCARIVEQVNGWLDPKDIAAKIRAVNLPVVGAATHQEPSDLESQKRESLGFQIKDLLGPRHPDSAMRIDASGVLRRPQPHACGVMLTHLERMAARFYASDIKAVDEFLQLYCLDEARPNGEDSTASLPLSTNTEGINYEDNTEQN